MTVSRQELESKLWQAADILRGQIDSADYKNYIFSILFLKRLSDRFNEEVELGRGFGPLSRWWHSKTGTSTSSSCRRPPGGQRLQGHQ